MSCLTITRNVWYLGTDSNCHRSPCKGDVSPLYAPRQLTFIFSQILITFCNLFVSASFALTTKIFCLSMAIRAKQSYIFWIVVITISIYVI